MSDKLAVIESLLPKVDKLLVGGGMCFTFLAAQGHEVGDSLLESDQVENCRRLLAESGDKIVLPTDIVVAADIAEDAADVGRSPPTRSRPVRRASTSGRRRSRRSPPRCADAQTVFWNGPMGVFEVSPFAAGTRGVAEAVGGGRRACRSSAAATRPPRCARSGWTSTRSATSRPAAARRWSTSRARRCPGSPSWTRSDEEPAARPVQTYKATATKPLPPFAGKRKPLIAGNWKMNLNHLEAIALTQKLAFSLKEELFANAEVRARPAVHRHPQRADADRRRQPAARLRRAGPLAARLRRLHRRHRRPDARPSWAASTSSSGTPSAASTTTRTTRW